MMNFAEFIETKRIVVSRCGRFAALVYGESHEKDGKHLELFVPHGLNPDEAFDYFISDALPNQAPGCFILLQNDGSFYTMCETREMTDHDLRKVEKFLWNEFAVYEYGYDGNERDVIEELLKLPKPKLIDALIESDADIIRTTAYELREALKVK